MTGPRFKIDIEKAKELYASGLSLEKVAMQVFASSGTVSSRLKEAGVTIRPSGREVGRHKLKCPDLKRLYEDERMTVAELARRFAVSKATVRTRVREQGLSRPQVHVR